MSRFIPYANENDVVRMGGLEIENRTDRVSLAGDLVLTRDQAGLILAKELQTLIDQIVRALESDKQLADKVRLKPARNVINPF